MGFLICNKAAMIIVVAVTIQCEEKQLIENKS